MRNRWRRYSCMNNNMQYMNQTARQGIMEDICDNVVSPATDYNSNCSCGFDDDYNDNVFPENPSLRTELCSYSDHE